MSEKAPRTNHALWLGPVLALAGLITYFTVFARFPVTRDVPFLNLPMAWAGVLFALAGLPPALKRGGWRIAAGAGGVLLTLVCAGFLTYYCFVLSAQMPAPGEGSAVDSRVPGMVLKAHDGSDADVGELTAGKLILVVFRGAW